MIRQISNKKPIIALDLETTGIDKSKDRIIEISMVWGLKSDEHYTRIVNPGIPIPPRSSEVHGFTDEQVKSLPGFASIRNDVLEILSSCYITGFNVSGYDIPLLTNEFLRCGVVWPTAQHNVSAIDTHLIFKKREPRTLSKAVEHYLGRTHEGAHGAYPDAAASLEILHAQVARYEDLPLDMDDLISAVHGKDPSWVDSDGKVVWHQESGLPVISFGKMKDIDLRTIKETNPGYLKWIISNDFKEDFKQICRDALKGKFPVRA